MLGKSDFLKITQVVKQANDDRAVEQSVFLIQQDRSWADSMQSFVRMNGLNVKFVLLLCTLRTIAVGYISWTLVGVCVCFRHHGVLPLGTTFRTPRIKVTYCCTSPRSRSIKNSISSTAAFHAECLRKRDVSRVDASCSCNITRTCGTAPIPKDASRTSCCWSGLSIRVRLCYKTCVLYEFSSRRVLVSAKQCCTVTRYSAKVDRAVKDASAPPFPLAVFKQATFFTT